MLERGARPKLAILFTLTLAAACLSWILWPGPWSCDSDFDHTKFAVIGSVKVTNPAYNIHEVGDYSPSACRASLGLMDKSRKMSFSLQPLGYDARKAWLYKNASVELELNGSLVGPRVKETYLSSIISNPATFHETPIKAVRGLLKEHPDAHYGLVVGFKEGIPWDTYRELVERNSNDGRLAAADVVFFSPFGTESNAGNFLRHNVKPIGWDWSDEVRELMGAGGEIEGDQLEEFRYWVSRLEPDDDRLLRRFRLSLSELRRWSQQGLVYGYISEARSKVHMKMLDSRHVDWARIIDRDPPTKID
ncbi:hypothetical protein HTZ77_40645 [Nonomuraea sp. SMC257]|uniref:Uncharacterized protein n=1 Tax=Nonomuraea montanisoli TaxID=2741721 RepID=A0A7Y6IGH2_9ACTN|nr:hypothetical protein [Nonomuraea montanisoli]NUW37671.1 hypothetical protein [Nonomuraea montanisoli]